MDDLKNFCCQNKNCPKWGESVESIHKGFNKYGFTVALTTVQKWAKKHGLNRQVGRPSIGIIQTIKNAY